MNILRQKNQTFEQCKNMLALLVLSGLFGVLISLVANYFVMTVKWFATLRIFSNSFFDINGWSFAPILWLFLAVFALDVIRRTFDITRWHGPADAVYACHRTDNELDLKRGIGSTLAALISLCGGAPVGQYGPLVNFGATIGSFVSQSFNVRFFTPEILMGCGVAAAISAGFHAPIAGIIFAHEAVLRHFSLRALVPIAVASATSAAFGNWAFGGSALFSLNVQAPELLPLMPALILSGVAFGLVSLVYMKLIFFFVAIPPKFKVGYLPFALMAAFITGIFGMFFPEVLGLGVEVIFKFITEDFGIWAIITLLGLKIFLTTLCVGFGIFGGVFSPALFIGAATGQFMSNLLGYTALLSTTSILAVSGMAAVAACVVGAPLAVIMIILELTMSYEYAIAALVSTMVAVMISNSLYGHSFFDKQLEQRGIDLSQGRGNLELMLKKVEAIVSQDYLVVSKNEKISSVIKKMSKNNNSEAYCIDKKGKFLGKCKLSEIACAVKNKTISNFLEKEPTSIKLDASILQAIEVASDFVGESIPVISRLDGKLAGVVTEADIFQAYMSTQVKINDLERR
ncbi:chloride channel protein [Alphaproteobacteria bacterium]|jgi:CIC family chloride channel protein|nr:chloride channel protein [Alphaproteobacteria bacterium]